MIFEGIFVKNGISYKCIKSCYRIVDTLRLFHKNRKLSVMSTTLLNVQHVLYVIFATDETMSYATHTSLLRFVYTLLPDKRLEKQIYKHICKCTCHAGMLIPGLWNYAADDGSLMGKKHLHDVHCDMQVSLMGMVRRCGTTQVNSMYNMMML